MPQTPMDTQPVSSNAGARWHLGPDPIFLPSAPRTHATACPPPPSLRQHPAGPMGWGQGQDYQHPSPHHISTLFKHSRGGCLQYPSPTQPSITLLPVLQSCPGTSTHHSVFPGQVFPSEHPHPFSNQHQPAGAEGVGGPGGACGETPAHHLGGVDLAVGSSSSRAKPRRSSHPKLPPAAALSGQGDWDS